MEKMLVTVPEAATLLGVGRSFAYELVQTGELPSVQLGRRALRVPVVEVRRYIERLQQVKEETPKP